MAYLLVSVIEMKSASKLEDDVSLAFWLPWLVGRDLCFFPCMLFLITRAGGILDEKHVVCTYHL